MKGKNFSCNNTGKRRKADFYETPYSVTQQLLDHENFIKHGSIKILEPACGNGAIINVLDNNNFTNITAYDLYSNASRNSLCKKDFLEEKENFDYIITNPPFSKAEQFIQKAKDICTNKFAFLLPLNYLHGQKRYEKNIFTDYIFPLVRVHIFTRYILFGEELRNDGKYNTGMISYAWFVWKRDSKQTHTEIKWINNNKYVLKLNH